MLEIGQFGAQTGVALGQPQALFKAVFGHGRVAHFFQHQGFQVMYSNPLRFRGLGLGNFLQGDGGLALFVVSLRLVQSGFGAVALHGVFGFQRPESHRGVVHGQSLRHAQTTSRQDAGPKTRPPHAWPGESIHRGDTTTGMTRWLDLR